MVKDTILGKFFIKISIFKYMERLRNIETTSHLKTCSEQPAKLTDCSTIVEWSEQEQATRRLSTGPSKSRPLDDRRVVVPSRPLDDRQVVRPWNHLMIVEWSDHRTTRGSSSGHPKQATRRSSSGPTIEPLNDRRVVCPKTPIQLKIVGTTPIHALSSKPRYDLLRTTAILSLTPS